MALAKTVNLEFKHDSLKLFHSFRWIKPLVRKGYKSDLKLKDLYKWSSEDDAFNLANKLERQELQNCCKKKVNHSLNFM
jgi:hypothetical protein